MINFIFYALKSFRKCFSHNSTWVVFCMVILGFIGANEMMGVTSLCRYWGLGEKGYHMFLNFFRSSAWSLGGIVSCWCGFVISQNKLISIDGRVVLQGDHTYVPKDGQRMPGVVTLHQNSETQSKPSYFRGHCWGAIVGLAGSLAAPFGIPLDVSIHQGFLHIDKENNKKEATTLGPRIVLMAMKFCLKHNLKCTLTLDAFFSKRKCF
ncbi:MAG: hypothetical protein GY797_08860 [Deltaproteobacteria bacterium]|nr:hypothetical protein [Deltaproteobacteria bacterium]